LIDSVVPRLGREISGGGSAIGKRAAVHPRFGGSPRFTEGASMAGVAPVEADPPPRS